MADYSPKYVNEMDVRNFFSPPLEHSDVRQAEILIKIESAEDYIDSVYELSSSDDARIPALLLIAAKIIQSPTLARKYYTLAKEQLGDYYYEMAQPISRGTDVQSSPYVISRTWERMAIEMLRARSAKRNYKWKIYISND